MKKILSVSIILSVLCCAVAASAVDLASLDKVSVLMTKEKVLSILGAPDEQMTLANGLKVDVYYVDSAFPLTNSGCIFNDQGILMGQSFVFQGHETGSIMERLKTSGFVQKQIESASKFFEGHDDDTGRPLVAVVSEGGEMTTITTFEKDFFEAQKRN